MNDEDLELGNPDNAGYYPGQKPPNVKFVGEDAAVVVVDSTPVHWSELPEPVVMEVPDWDFGDNNKRDPENNWEEDNE